MSQGATLPDALGAFLEAAGRLAAAAAERGDHLEARRALEAALRALDEPRTREPVLRVVGSGEGTP